MIRFLATGAHGYTHAAIVSAMPDVTVLSYERALRERALPVATYIFTDLDRLGFWELELAADLYRLLERGGCRVLNDPARVTQRAGLLHRLHAIGMNRFAAWRAEDGVLPDRFPAFLRTTAAHRGVLTGLLADRAAAEAALEQAVADGYPLRDLLFVEYCAEPGSEGRFWKHSVYRIGAALVPGASVLDTSWVAKEGISGLASDDDFARERDIVRDRTFIDMVGPAFDAAAIDYGRADFAIVGGRAAIYEINTNPHISLPTGHRSAIRTETLHLVWKTYLDALSALEEPRGGGRVELASPRFDRGFVRHGLRRRFNPP